MGGDGRCGVVYACHFLLSFWESAEVIIRYETVDVADLDL